MVKLTPIPAPEIPQAGMEIAAHAAAERSALLKTIAPTEAPRLATQVVGNVAPAIMSTLMHVGTAAIMLLGMKTIVTGKPPFKSLNNIV